jgi:hypothetical protein
MKSPDSSISVGFDDWPARAWPLRAVSSAKLRPGSSVRYRSRLLPRDISTKSAQSAHTMVQGAAG